MKTLLPFLFALLLAQAPQAPPAVPFPANPADYGGVEGTVVWASQSTPLEGIPVYLRKSATENIQEAQRRGIATSDSAGHFLLKDIPPGEYIVVAERRGYFRESDAELRVVVPVRGTVKNVAIRLIVSGTISGRILDLNGLGLAGVQVSTAQPVYLSSGKRDMQDRESGSTDDRGEFRIRALRPGSYYVRANVDFWASDSLTYYPGVKDPSGAIAVTVREAQDSNASFRVEPRMKTVLTISGTVVSSISGVPAGPVTRIMIATRDGGSTYYDNRASDMSNGRFEIRNIFPDVYDLFPSARDKDGVLYTSRTTVQLVDQNLENLILAASPLVEVRGRVLLNGEPPAGRLDGVTLGIEVVQGLGPLQTAASVQGGFCCSTTPIAIDRENGDFTTGRLAPGIYKVASSRMPPDFYLEDLRQGGSSVYTDGFSMTDQPGQPLEVLIAGPGGKLEGLVLNSRHEPAARATVVLVPDAARREDRRRYFNTQTDSEGKFVFRAIAPGTYKVFAWESIPASAWLNAEFMQKYESRGETTILSKGTSTKMELIWIPREQEQ